MSLPLVLRHEAAALVVELNKLYGTTEIPQLPDILDAADAFLPLYIAERIRQNCSLFIVQCKQAPPGPLRSRNLEFEVLVGERVSHYDELDIAFVRRDYPRDMTVVTGSQATISEPGRYKTILVEWSSGLKVKGGDVSQLAVTLVEVTYRWIEELITRLVKEDESEMVRSLYTIFRPACVNDQLRDSLVFAAVTKYHTVYLVDREYATHALAIAARESTAVMESPARVLAEILNGDIPYDLSMSKMAIDANRVRVSDLRRAKYKNRTGPFLPVAEAIVHDSKMVAVFPVVREGDELLVAVAPGSLRDEMKRTLPDIAQRLAEQFTGRRGMAGHILARIKARLPAEAGGEIAYWFGRFTSGVLHTH